MSAKGWQVTGSTADLSTIPHLPDNERMPGWQMYISHASRATPREAPLRHNYFLAGTTTGLQKPLTTWNILQYAVGCRNTKPSVSKHPKRPWGSKLSINKHQRNSLGKQSKSSMVTFQIHTSKFIILGNSTAVWFMIPALGNIGASWSLPSFSLHFKKNKIYWAVPGLRCSMQTLSCGMWDLGASQVAQMVKWDLVPTPGI